MLNDLAVKLLFSVGIFFTILLAGLYPLYRQKLVLHLHGVSLGETLATGVFLGAGLLHMLPDAAMHFTENGYHYPFAYLITGILFLLFLWFEHVGQALYRPHTAHKDPSTPHESHPAFACLAWSMLSIHSFILGTALGINDNRSMVIMLFLAIITHKWAESFALAIQLNQTSMRSSIKYILFIIFACMTPAGIFFGWLFEDGTRTSIVSPILMAASAGTFLYLGTLHGLERCVLVERCCNLADFSFVIIGFLIMAAVAIYL